MMDAWLRRFVGMIVGKIVLPAQLIPLKPNGPLKHVWAFLFYSGKERRRIQNLYNDFVEKNNNKLSDQLDIERYTVNCDKDNALDTIEMCHPWHQRSKKYVVYGWGRSDCYEKNLERLATDTLNLRVHVLSFNYRGVGHSSGQPYTENDVAQDYYQQVKRLICEKNIKPEDIYCYGHSLGGAISILAVDKLRKEGYPVKIYNDRSFHHLINVSTGVNFEKPRPRKVITQVGTTLLLTPLLMGLFAFSLISFLQLSVLSLVLASSFYVQKAYQMWDKFVGNFLNNTMRRLMQYGNWVMDVAPLFDNIPQEAKRYTITKGYAKKSSASQVLGERYTQGHTYDKVIHHRHALYQRLHQHHAQKQSLKQSYREALSEQQSNNTLRKIKSALFELSSAKMTGGMHMDWPQQFITRYAHPAAGRPLTGQERLYDFVEPEGRHVCKSARHYKKF
ncbi:alpha/beta fold hydrolase [Candidatus Berkiella cookevillensis]|uniref:Alpha/beta fold hydrolase n=2 Tax=Candidatus Berkiella cookevillensis TaxID=437022 RepID=A0AAE3HRD7_9GAMM|nr:alpha/beta fold hydrolase [Candidatus Berkiella cookevillensis]MCS5709252.1 alpha/beta fold hydrolase [Candidatus Berkiella cookevillensis]